MKSNHVLDNFAEFVALNWTDASWVVPELNANNLEDLKSRYRWNGATYEENTMELDQLSKGLLTALDRNDCGEARSHCIDILKWGGVLPKNYRGSYSNKTLSPRSKLGQIIEQKTLENELCRWIDHSLCLAKSGRIDEFNSKGYISNSSMTKVHSLADKEAFFIIYDTRVAAALCFLVKIFLRSQGVLHTPPLLQFGRTPGNKPVRDATEPPYKFSRYYNYSLHAKYNYLSSVVVLKAQSMLDGVTSRDIEASLFMLGQDLDQIKFEV